MAKIKLETKRLYMREFTCQDLTWLIDLNSDPEVMRYTGDTVRIVNLTEARKVFDETIAPQYINAIGRWMIFIKNGNEFAGWCGLKKTDMNTDLGFRLKRKFWNQGFATEAAEGVLSYARQYQIKGIIASAEKQNLASIKVLMKCGFIKSEEREEEGRILVIFRHPDF